MMMYDDFTNEDVGNVIMDADINPNNSAFNETSPEFRSFPSRRRKRKRNRNRNNPRVSRRKPGKSLKFIYLYPYIQYLLNNLFSLFLYCWRHRKTTIQCFHCKRIIICLIKDGNKDDYILVIFILDYMYKTALE